MLFALTIVIGSYIIFVSILLWGWSRTGSPAFVTANQLTVTVIVPVRNEEENIASLIECLLKQSLAHFEVIIVDDDSSDRTIQIAQSFRDPRVKVIKNNGLGKKMAIDTGVRAASNEIIVTTDGDCVFGSEWLYTIQQAFSNDVSMVAGPVRMEAIDFLGRLQQIEFSSLVGSAGALIQLGKPVMCNGANLAFRKSAFFEVRGYEGNFNVASGDDEFLMRKILSRFPSGVRFLKNQAALVSTHAATSLSQLIHQRRRWAAKSRRNTSFFGIAVAIYVAFVQLSTLVVMGYAFVNPQIALPLLLLRFAADGIVLTTFCRFLTIPFSPVHFIVLSVCYPLYVCYIAVTSLFTTFEWKGRPYTS